MSVMQVQDFCDEEKEYGSVGSLAGVEGPPIRKVRDLENGARPPCPLSFFLSAKPVNVRLSPRFSSTRLLILQFIICRILV
jgi:hypothetical protein